MKNIENKIHVYIIFLLLVLLNSCDLFESTSETKSEFPEAKKQNIDEKQLIQAYNDIGQVPGIKSLLVARNDQLVAEQYFNGHGADIVHDVRSVTKSVTSVLIGIAIDKGFILNVDEPMGKYLNHVVDNLSPQKSNITIRHLLTMSGGFDWVEFGDWSEYSNWYNAEDQINYILNKEIVTTPGQVFNYNDGASHLLSVILTEATGMSTRDFADHYLFGPLDIGSRPWAVDNRGYYKGCVALELTSRDMIKLGNLYLNNGKYEGTQIVSATWVTESTKKQISTFDVIPYGTDYGYLWWLDTANSKDFYYANGYGGQFIFVVPELNLVVVATCQWRNVGANSDQNWYDIIWVIVNKIIPAVKE